MIGVIHEGGGLSSMTTTSHFDIDCWVNSSIGMVPGPFSSIPEARRANCICVIPPRDLSDFKPGKRFEVFLGSREVSHDVEFLGRIVSSHLLYNELQIIVNT